MAVYSCIAGYYLVDPNDTQYDHKVICYFLMILKVCLDIKSKRITD